jgi:ATP-dependent DNA ligase
MRGPQKRISRPAQRCALAGADRSWRPPWLYYAFDLLHLDGQDLSGLQLIERKALLEPLVEGVPGLQFNGHETGDGEIILRHAGKLGFEGIVSKTIDAPYAPGNRGLWRKAKCLNRQEFVIVGWSDPEGTRPHLGALLLGYYSSYEASLRDTAPATFRRQAASSLRRSPTAQGARPGAQRPP